MGVWLYFWFFVKLIIVNFLFKILFIKILLILILFDFKEELMMILLGFVICMLVLLEIFGVRKLFGWILKSVMLNFLLLFFCFNVCIDWLRIVVFFILVFFFILVSLDFGNWDLDNLFWVFLLRI